MAGHEQGESLVAHLRVRHPLAAGLFILRQQQHRQQIARILAAGAAFPDQTVDGGIQPRPGFLEAAHGGQRQLLQVFGEWKQEQVEHLQHRGHRLADLGSFRLHVGAEERLAYDRQSEARHLRGYVQRFAGLPTVALAHRAFRDHVRIGSQALAMEGGLHQPPLPKMVLALARKQTFAQEHFGALQATALDEVRLLSDEHFADVVRVAHHVEVAVKGAKVGQVAVFARNAAKKAQRIRAEWEQVADDRRIPGARWSRGGHQLQFTARRGAPAELWPVLRRIVLRPPAPPARRS